MNEPTSTEELSVQKRGKKRRKAAECYHCGSKEHRAKLCPTACCQICHQPGHNVAACPNRPKSPVSLGSFQNMDLDPKDGSRKLQFTYIELFAGMGGFRVALDRLGGRCVFASEVDRFCIETYRQNFGDVPAGDITRITTDQIPAHDLLVGGFPCQPFSTSGSQTGFKDPKGVMFREITRILKAKQPKGFLLENVRGLLLHDEGKTLNIVVKELQDCGYSVHHQLLDAVDLLPQERKRLFLAGIRNDIDNAGKFQFPNVPSLKRGVKDILHSASGMDALTDDNLHSLTLNDNQLSKVNAQKYTQAHPEARFLSDVNQPAKTIQSSYARYMVGSQFVSTELHSPREHTHGEGSARWRRFSPREAARLQGFPESFKLCNDRAYHMIGNAVAPPLIALVAASLLNFLEIVRLADHGWSISKQLLIDAVPDDSRKEELQRNLEEAMSRKGRVG